MAERFDSPLIASRITPPEVFFDRRRFLAGLGAAAALPAFAIGGQAAAAAALPEAAKLTPPLSRPDVFPAKRDAAYELPEGIAHDMTPRDVAASHNNFYEFLPGRGGPAWEAAGEFVVEPWSVEIGGECARPQTLDLDDLFAFPHEERVYHFRCVERWAMNVPWSGFPLSKLLERVEPAPTARYVRFVSANRPSQMPGIEEAHWYPWPYFEALRMDEAMNELTLVVTGVYGEPLLKQHGAPVRVVVPWKYGYKNPKSIVKIELLREEPGTFWQIQPHEYGFLSNVNPNIPHPRWSQARSYWLHDQEPFETPIFNGYERYVAALYPDEPRTLQRPLRPGETAR
jgi:sulfoxide reductase catalytic subunit YedY